MYHRLSSLYHFCELFILYLKWLIESLNFIRDSWDRWEFMGKISGRGPVCRCGIWLNAGQTSHSVSQLNKNWVSECSINLHCFLSSFVKMWSLSIRFSLSGVNTLTSNSVLYDMLSVFVKYETAKQINY